MSHQEYVQEVLKQFNADQLAELYIDTALDKEDQTQMSLAEHLEESENWAFASYSMSCDIRHAESANDLMDYINTTLEKVS